MAVGTAGADGQHGAARIRRCFYREFGACRAVGSLLRTDVCTRVRFTNQASMPLIRSLASSSFQPRHQSALNVVAFLVACALCVAATAAHAQFGNTLNGNPDSLPDAAASSTSGTSNTLPRTGSDTPSNKRRSNTNSGDQPEPRDSLARPAPYHPGEFELFVDQLVPNLSGREPILRFGSNLLTDPQMSTAAQDPLPTVPTDYIIRPGDEIALTLWGTVDADLLLTVDRAGRIAVPGIGSIMVAGLYNADLADAISRRVGQVYKNFHLTATLGRVRAIRVFVGGYAQHPGSTTVNGLSSVLHAIMRAGGPSAAGSFRDIHLRRNGHEVAVFDLYNLLLKGDRNTDQLVQPDDVIFIGAVGTQVAILGSVNLQAIYELKPTETLNDALRMAGGFNAVADRSRVAIERLADRTTGHVTELTLPEHAGDTLATGDVVHVFSSVTAALSKVNQNERVRIEGEVAHPGDYVLPPGSHIADALRAAGGMTSSAYPYGAEFTRYSVRKTQEVNYDRALRDLETDMSRTQAHQRATSAEEISAQSSSASANARLLERLREAHPTGRLVLQLQPDATSLPDLALEDGDTLFVPARNSAVGVFGSVFNTGSFVFEGGHTASQYLALAGGPTRGADTQSSFMIRANGSVISARQGASFWHSGNDFGDATVQPGDTIFIPEELDKSTFAQDAKDWTQILFQFGLGVAGIKSLGL